MSLRVAVGQIAAGADVGQSLAAIASATEAAAQLRAELLVLPEGVMGPFAHAPRIAEPLDGPFVHALRRLSSELAIAIVAGMYEAGAGGHTFNTLVVVRDGAILRSYRKIHLFDGLGVRESDSFAAGDGELSRFVIDHLRVALITCYDLRFPELSRAHARAGMDVLLVPAAWYPGPLKEEQWSVLIRARAIENVCYVVGAGQPAPRFIGRSMVVDPRGIVMRAADERPRTIGAELDSAALDEARAQLPALEHMRVPVGATRP